MPGMVMPSGLEVVPSSVPGRYQASAEFGMAGALADGSRMGRSRRQRLGVFPRNSAMSVGQSRSPLLPSCSRRARTPDSPPRACRSHARIRADDSQQGVSLDHGDRHGDRARARTPRRARQTSRSRAAHERRRGSGRIHRCPSNGGTSHLAPTARRWFRAMASRVVPTERTRPTLRTAS